MKTLLIALCAMAVSCVEDGPSDGKSVSPLSVATPEPAEVVPELDPGRITVACTSGQHGGLSIAEKGEECSASLTDSGRTLVWTWRVGEDGLVDSSLFAPELVAHFENDVPLAGETLASFEALENRMRAAMNPGTGSQTN